MEQLKLFEDTAHLKLPLHLLEYRQDFFSKPESDQYLQTFLQTIPWQQHVQKIYDKEVVTPRLSAWYGERPIRDEDKRTPIPWTPELVKIKGRIEANTGITFDGVLLNYYRDGNDSVAWHSDKDTVPGIKTPIASVSFGQARAFDFRHKDNHREKHSILLEHGSLLLMKGGLQQYWEHRIAKSTLPMSGRVNLTFRIVR